MKELNLAAAPLNRRLFLERLSLVGGMSLVMAGMDAFGMGIASAQTAPPSLSGGSKGKKVVILGAGVAGMTAAYELDKAGYQVQVIEARSFAGGRCQTARKGFSLTELGGETQTCNFDEGLYINHGPWRIPYHHRSTLHYAKQFGVPLEIMINDNDASYVYFEKGSGPLAGKRVRKGQIAADMRGHAAELLAKSVQTRALDAPMTADDKELFLQYLAQEGYLSRKELTYTGTEGRGFDVDPGPGLDPGPGKASTPFAMTDILHSRTWRLLQSVANYDQQRTMFQPVGGMSMIARGFEKNVGRMIKYSTEVEKVSQDDSGVTVNYVGPNGQRGTVTADYCLCAIPLSVVRGIDMGVSAPFKQAIAQPSYAPVGKIGLQMKRRFWEEDDFIYGGHIYTDNPDIGSITLPSGGWQSQKGVILGYYHFGATAAKISALSPAGRAEVAIAAGEKVFPQYRPSYETAFSVGWHRVKYNLGGWCQWNEEGRKTAYPTLLQPDGRIYLAGEHLSYLTGWQAGGIESAWQQIAKLHSRVQAA